jgi:hypothetical protein
VLTSPNATASTRPNSRRSTTGPRTRSSRFADDQGELEIPSNVTLSFNAAGKEYQNLRIDEAVRAFQSDLGNAVTVARNERQAREQVQQQSDARVTALEQDIAANNRHYERLLTDPAFYQEAATRFQALNTPEQRLARIQQQQAEGQRSLEQQRQAMNLQHAITVATNNVQTRIAPAVDALAKEFNIPWQDALDRFNTLTAPLMRARPDGNVWIPLDQHPRIESEIIPQLRTWAQSRSAASTAATNEAKQQADAKTKKAQLDAQLAKRQAARPLTPLGSAPVADVPKPKPIKTSGDAVDSIVDKARQMLIASGAA